MQQKVSFLERNKTLRGVDLHLTRIYAECTKLFRKESKVPYEQLNWDKINDFKSRFLRIQDNLKKILPNDFFFDQKKEEINIEALNLLNLARSIIDDAFLKQNRLLSQLNKSEKLKELENNKNDVIEILKRQENILDSNTTNNIPIYELQSLKNSTKRATSQDSEQTIDLGLNRSQRKELVEKISTDCSDSYMVTKKNDIGSVKGNLFPGTEQKIDEINEQEEDSSNKQIQDPYNFIKELKDILFKHNDKSECSRHGGLYEIIIIFNKNRLSNSDIYQKIQRIVTARTRGWLDWYGSSATFGAGRNQAVEVLYKFNT